MLGGILAGLAVVAPTAAAPPERTCAERAEIGRPQQFSASAGSMRLGSLMFVNPTYLQALTPAELRRTEGRLPSFKVGVLVKASRVVTLTVAPESRAFARLLYDGADRPRTGSLSRHPASVVIRACPKDRPAFSYDGVVGPATAFPGGFVTAGTGTPRCVVVQLRERGKRRTFTRTVPFGAIRC